MKLKAIEQQAQEAVEDKLGLRSVLDLDTREEDFLKDMIATYRHYSTDVKEGRYAFFADVIPRVSSIIQVFVEPGRFLRAIDWAKEEFQTDKPISILTVLTTAYLVQRGRKKAADTETATLWQEIGDLLGTLVAKIPDKRLPA